VTPQTPGNGRETGSSPRRRGSLPIIALSFFALIAVGWLVASQLMREDVEGRHVLINLDNAANRVEMYKLDNGRYPARLTDLLGRYARESELKDIWGNPYVYAVPGTQGRPFDLTTLGADGKAGGEGRDRDRTWTMTVK
jgi:type II secretory pathway pseudopilin PulG